MFEGVRKLLRLGRRPAEPKRDTVSYPIFRLNGSQRPGQRTVWKPTPRNLRYFAKTPYARRAINAIKNPISMMEWEVVPLPGIKTSPELERQIETATYCLANPNRDDSFRSLMEQVLEDTLCGAGAIETQVSGDAVRPVWMYPVDGLSIQLYPAWSGDDREPRYAQMVGAGYSGGDRAIPLRDDELIYIRPNPTTASPFGLGPLEVAFTSISRALGVGEFAANVSSNAKPSVMIAMGDAASSEDAVAFREYWTNDIEGQGKTPIVGNGGDVKRLFPDGDNALFLKYQDFLKSEVATAFDLSPMNLGVERDVNRNTAEVSEGRDWDQAIKPRAKEIESYLTKQVLHRRLGFYQLRFNFIGLDRENVDVMSQVYVREYQNGAILPDEYRERRGLPPMEGPWGKMAYADTQIAIQAARGAAQVLDDDLPKPLPLPKPDKKD